MKSAFGEGEEQKCNLCERKKNTRGNDKKKNFADTIKESGRKTDVKKNLKRYVWCQSLVQGCGYQRGFWNV